MSEVNVQMAEVYQLVGELYVNNAMMSKHIAKQAKELEAMNAKNQVLERQIKILEGNSNGSGSEE